MSETKGKIAVLTSGGDAPGMNAAIRAVVRTGISKGYEVYGVRRGYNGILNREMDLLTFHDVSEKLQHGGTFLFTARSAEFREEEGKKKAAAICKELGIETLIVIGGDGSFTGAKNLSKYGANVIGLPGTIDLDIAYTEYTIGFDTAVNTAMEAIDRLRETSNSHERCSVVEVMGRSAGYIALWCGIANGAEEILLPEKFDNNYDKLIEEIKNNRASGMTHQIIVNAEGIGHSYGLAKKIEEATGKETVKPINADSLDRLILQFLGSSKKMEDISEQLIEITADGIVDETEVAAFDAILDELERMSVNIQSLMLWAQKNRDALQEKNN